MTVIQKIGFHFDQMEPAHIPDSIEDCESEEEEEAFINEQARRADILMDIMKYGEDA
jgi:hypothetical protein